LEKYILYRTTIEDDVMIDFKYVSDVVIDFVAFLCLMPNGNNMRLRANNRHYWPLPVGNSMR